jgi:hypothetical protein
MTGFTALFVHGASSSRGSFSAAAMVTTIAENRALSRQETADLMYTRARQIDGAKRRRSGMVRKHQNSGAQLRTAESRDSQGRKGAP